tara:strand:+ start:1309 stop:1587 length:279 start_codon:yes stop_codon:yes gene_type:complete
MTYKKNINIPDKAQWLSGTVGSGSWFFISTQKSKYRIQRLSPEGVLECDRLFTVDKSSFDINIDYKFTFLSHCKECSIIQNEITYKFYHYEY